MFFGGLQLKHSLADIYKKQPVRLKSSIMAIFINAQLFSFQLLSSIYGFKSMLMIQFFP